MHSEVTWFLGASVIVDHSLEDSQPRRLIIIRDGARLGLTGSDRSAAISREGLLVALGASLADLVEARIERHGNALFRSWERCLREVRTRENHDESACERGASII